MGYEERPQDMPEESDFVVSVSVEDLNLSHQAREFSSRLLDVFSQARENGHERISLNFETVNRISSAGLNELIAINSQARGEGLQIILLDVQENVREVFALTRLERLFDFAATASVGR